ncbi:MAG: glycosyltransferase [bacterium]|nr:glycosyltransferase [bacterium]
MDKGKLRIGILMPSYYMSQTRFPNRICSPRELGVNLANALVDRGHDVTVFSTEDTKTRAKLVASSLAFLPTDMDWRKERDRVQVRRKTKKESQGTMHVEFELLSRAYRMAAKGLFDIFHSFHSFGENQHGAHYFEDITGFPTVYTLHNTLPEKGTPSDAFLERWKHHRFVAISSSQRQKGNLHFTGTVHNGILPEAYPPNFTDNRKVAYLAWMGRVYAMKGLDDAVRVAIKLHQQLHFAPTNVEQNGDPKYFEKDVLPLLHRSDYRAFSFLQNSARARFLAQAKVFLFPIHWDEPFGMTMIEAMATGTPVIAFGRGAVPEVVVSGKTGFIVPESDGIDGLIEAVKKIDALSPEEYKEMRKRCRRHVEAHFTVEHMTAGYEAIYRRMLEKKN